MAEGDEETSSSAAQDSQQNQVDPDQVEEGTIVTEGNKKCVVDSEGVRHQVPKMGGCEKPPDGPNAGRKESARLSRRDIIAYKVWSPSFRAKAMYSRSNTT